MPPPEDAANTWVRRLWPWRWALAGPLLVVVIVRGIRLITRGQGDLQNHLLFGQRFARGQFIYEGGLDIVYPPFWAMAHAPFSLLPVPLATGLMLLIGLGLGVVLMVVLALLGRRAMPLRPQLELAALVVALLLASRFIVSDVSLGNPNTALAALTWLGVYLWSRGRDFVGGAALGLAVALKCTAGLFIAWFLWKRQWKMALCSSLATLLLSVAPILWSGPAQYQREASFWTSGLIASLRQPDPSIGILGQEQVQNNALKAAMVRYLMHLGPGHAGRVDHWLYVDFLDLSPAAAKLAISAASALLLIIAGWCFRRPVRQRDDAEVLLECAAVSVLMLLLSPVTWSAHLVWMIPGFYLAARYVLWRGEVSGWIVLAGAVYVLAILGLPRDLLGREVSLVLDSYHVQTGAMLLVLVVVLALHHRCAKVARQGHAAETSAEGSPRPARSGGLDSA